MPPGCPTPTMSTRSPPATTRSIRLIDLVVAGGLRVDIVGVGHPGGIDCVDVYADVCRSSARRRAQVSGDRRTDDHRCVDAGLLTTGCDSHWCGARLIG